MISEYQDICLICGKPKTDIHHLVYGRGLRELAEKDNLKIPLCRACHESIHKIGIAGVESKIIGQLTFEIDKVEEGMSQKEARELFRQRYGRSYL